MTTNGNITLSQGLERFYEENAEYLSHENDGVSGKAKVFFTAHDIAHVVFGCDTSLFGEGSVKIWTIFGTSLGFWNHIRGYKEANALTLSRNFTLGHIARNIFKFLCAIPTLILRAKRMSKPWPWSEFEPYLNMTIAEIRKEFNIEILP